MADVVVRMRSGTCCSSKDKEQWWFLFLSLRGRAVVVIVGTMSGG